MIRTPQNLKHPKADDKAVGTLLERPRKLPTQRQANSEPSLFKVELGVKMGPRTKQESYLNLPTWNQTSCDDGGDQDGSETAGKG